MKHHLVMILSACLLLCPECWNLAAQSIPLILLQGENNVRLELTEQTGGVKAEHPRWSGNDAPRTLYYELPAVLQWEKRSISFLPSASGNVTVQLRVRGNGSGSRKEKTASIRYDNIRLDGTPIANGGFEDGDFGFQFHGDQESPSRIINNPLASGTGNHCGQVMENAHISFQLNVRKNRRHTLTFDCAPAEAKPIAEENDYHPLDLGKFGNMAFADEKAGDGKGGWSDQGPQNDLRNFPSGPRAFGGIPFVIADPKDNDGRSMIVLKGDHAPFGKPSVAIPVGKVCSRLYLLNAFAWGKDNGVAANLTIRYSDGTEDEVPLNAGTDVGGWWHPEDLNNAKVVWRSVAGNSISIGIYLTAIRLNAQKKVKEIIVRSGDPEFVYGILGMTAALIRKPEKTVLDSTRFEVEFAGRSTLKAIPLETLGKTFRRRKLSPEIFFDRHALKKLRITNRQGEPLDFAIAVFERNLQPVILFRSSAPPDRVILKWDGPEKLENMLTPQKAFQKITGQEGAPYAGTEWVPENALWLPPSGMRLVNVQTAVSRDSFYQRVALMDRENQALEYEFSVSRPVTYKFYINICAPRETAVLANRFNLIVDGKESDSDRYILGGIYYRPYTPHWCGEQRISFSPGKHTLRIVPEGAADKRNGLTLTGLYMAADQKQPVNPGFIEEMKALKAAGFDLYGIPDETIRIHPDPSRDRLRRIVNERKSYPDMSCFSRNPIDQRGALHADGSGMRFDDGTPLPFLWGCNMTNKALYDMCREDRVGGDGLDQLVKRLKSMGYSFIRIFWETWEDKPWMVENGVHPYGIQQNPVRYKPEFVQSFQRLIKACHDNGMYLKLTLWNDYPVRHIENAQPTICFIHPEARRLLKEHIAMLFDVPNPYRGGVRPAEDPTVAIMEIENERNFFGGEDLYKNPERADWSRFSPENKKLLYRSWHAFLKEKYGTFDAVRRQWGKVPLKKGETEERIANIEFAPTWDLRKWGVDKSEFNFKLDDLRIADAEFGTDKRSNPAVSDGFEFMYRIYAGYLKDMYAYIRSLGFRGIITSCGPDTELHYTQRAAAADVVDATSGGTSYWNRSGYGFLYSLGWLKDLVANATRNKPNISREYGPNLAYANAWWGNVMTAAIQKAMGKAYLFNFDIGLLNHTIIPDYLYPEDNLEPMQVCLQQDSHIYSHFSNLAAMIAVHSPELRKPEFKVDIGFPLDNVFYTASFRGYNKMTFRDFTPFLYTDSSVKVFRDVYDGSADLVVNEPATPAGDYSRAKNWFAVRPHSIFDRYGKPNGEWLKGKTFKAKAAMSDSADRMAFYDAVLAAGGKMPVSRDEFGKVWRDEKRHLELNTEKKLFHGDTKTFGTIIGDLSAVSPGLTRWFTVRGTGDVWSFFGKTPGGDVFFAVLNGEIDIKSPEAVRYLFIGSSDSRISADGAMFCTVLSGSTVNLALKTDEKSLVSAGKLYVTFFRSRSCSLPAEIHFASPVKSVYACGANGNRIAEIPIRDNGFTNLWQHGHDISYYEVIFNPAEKRTERNAK